MATVFRSPLFSTPRQDPRRQSVPENGPASNLLLTTLRSKDAFFSGAGCGPEYDYPTPPERRYPLQLRTWLQPLNPNLVSKDKFFTVAGLGPDYDYPNPTPQRHELYHKTWTNAVNLNLVSKDKFFSAAGEAPRYDWPTPAERRRPGFDHVQSTNLSLLTVPVVPKPFNLSDWPAPPSRFVPRDTLTSTLPLNLNLTSHGMPFDQTDWPTPPNRADRPDLRTWIDSLKRHLAGLDRFFGAPGQPPTYDYPLPIPRPIASELRTWLESFSPDVLAPVVTRPFSNADLSLTQKREFIAHLRTWISDLLPVELQRPFPTYDLSTPQGRKTAIELKTWAESLNLNLLGKDKFYGGAGQPPSHLELNKAYERKRAIEWILSSFAPNIPNISGHLDQMCAGIENRTLYVQAEDRTAEISGENRTYRIPKPKDC